MKHTLTAPPTTHKPVQLPAQVDINTLDPRTKLHVLSTLYEALIQPVPQHVTSTQSEVPSTQSEVPPTNPTVLCTYAPNPGPLSQPAQTLLTTLSLDLSSLEQVCDKLYAEINLC